MNTPCSLAALVRARAETDFSAGGSGPVRRFVEGVVGPACGANRTWLFCAPARFQGGWPILLHLTGFDWLRGASARQSSVDSLRNPLPASRRVPCHVPGSCFQTFVFPAARVSPSIC
jgi:hypothetical protein